ncbi:MAG TPA: hypothetical protein VIM14_04890 [Polyangia bacterium]
MKSSLLGMALRAAAETKLCLLFITAISCRHSSTKNGVDSGGEGQPDVAPNTDLGVTPEAGIPTRGLTLMDGVVYDSNQNVYWLAEANLAVTPDGLLIRDKISAADGGLDLSGISPNGTMDFATAKNWVQALNQVVWNGCGEELLERQGGTVVPSGNFGAMGAIGHQQLFRAEGEPVAASGVCVRRRCP